MFKGKTITLPIAPTPLCGIPDPILSDLCSISPSGLTPLLATVSAGITRLLGTASLAQLRKELGLLTFLVVFTSRQLRMSF
jgi:hypothetical protein